MYKLLTKRIPYSEKTGALTVAITFGLLMGAMAVSKVIALRSFVFDLGLFDSLFYNVIHQGEWFRIFFGHAHPLALLYVPFLTVMPGKCWPVFLVGSQAVMLSLPLIMIWRTYGRIPGLVYVLYVPVWINMHFDFHFDHLAVPLLLGFYLGARAGRPYLSIAWALVLMAVKEPFALQTSACGVFMVWMGARDWLLPTTKWNQTLTLQQRRDFIISGCILAAAGILYFVFATHFLIPYFTPGTVRASLDSGAFSWLGHSLGQMIFTILTHPLDILRDIWVTPGKLIYLFVVFGFLAFIPLLAPEFLIPALPLLAIAMLSQMRNYYDYNTHYTAGLIVPLILAFIHGLPKAKTLWTWVMQRMGVHCSSRVFTLLLLGWILAGHVALSPSPISRLFWSDKVWSYNLRAYIPTDRENMMKAAILRYIPADPNVSVSSQNAINGYHLAHRRVYVPFPMGIDTPTPIIGGAGQTAERFWHFLTTGEKSVMKPPEQYAEMVVLDLHRPWFLGDQGCEWLYGECRDPEMAQKFMDMLKTTRRLYETVFEQDGFMISKRRLLGAAD